MALTTIQKLNYDEAPEFMSLILLSLLFKLGGQISLSLEELMHIQNEFPEIRIALPQSQDLTPESFITLTLRSRNAENDRPTEGYIV